MIVKCAFCDERGNLLRFDDIEVACCLEHTVDAAIWIRAQRDRRPQ